MIVQADTIECFTQADISLDNNTEHYLGIMSYCDTLCLDFINNNGGYYFYTLKIRVKKTDNKLEFVIPFKFLLDISLRLNASISFFETKKNIDRIFFGGEFDDEIDWDLLEKYRNKHPYSKEIYGTFFTKPGSIFNLYFNIEDSTKQNFRAERDFYIQHSPRFSGFDPVSDYRCDGQQKFPNLFFHIILVE